MRLYFQQPAFDEQLLRVVSHTFYGCADIGECMAAASRVKEGDLDSWHEEWRRLGDRCFSEGEAAEGHQQATSARSAYLRAANYYRSATFFDLQPAPPVRLQETFALHTEAFKRAVQYLSPAPRAVKIPCSGASLPGYFYSSGRHPRPTIIFNSGCNSCHQEAYFTFVQAAQQRGYNTLAFDGPGQGTLLVNDRLPMRPDWENVISPLVDFLVTKKEVDPAKIVLFGQSWGGLLAARAAAKEKRIAALVVNPGYFAAMESLKRVAMEGESLPGDEYHKKLDAFLQAAMKDKFVAAKFLARMHIHGVSTPKELFQEWERYSLAGCAGEISCPTLVCDSENEHLTQPQAKTFYDALSCKKQYILFTNSEGAGAHCAAGGSALLAYRLFDWLGAALVMQLPVEGEALVRS